MHLYNTNWFCPICFGGNTIAAWGEQFADMLKIKCPLCVDKMHYPGSVTFPSKHNWTCKCVVYEHNFLETRLCNTYGYCMSAKQNKQSKPYPGQLFEKLIKKKTSCCLSSDHQMRMHQDNPPSSFHFFWFITQSNERGHGAKDWAAPWRCR